MQSFWCICIRISIIQLKVCKTDRIVYEDTTAEKYTSIKILNGSGITVKDEQEVVKEVKRFWGKLFCTTGKVTLGQKMGMIGKGMPSKGQIFSQQEMSVAIKKLKENKAADESGVLAEYLKALEVDEVEKLRGLINGILNSADIPKEWKESRVKLLHKGGRTDELKTTDGSR